MPCEINYDQARQAVDWTIDYDTEFANEAIQQQNNDDIDLSAYDDIDYEIDSDGEYVDNTTVDSNGSSNDSDYAFIDDE